VSDDGELPDSAHAAIFGEMARVEPTVIPQLMDGLRCKPDLACTLQHALSEVADQHPELCPVLVDMIADSIQPVRMAVLRILGSMGDAGEKALYELITRLRDCVDWDEAEVLAESIGRIASRCSEWLEVLVSNIRKSSNKYLQELFALALCHSAEQNAPVAVRFIEEILEDSDVYLRRSVCNAVTTAYDLGLDLRAVYPKLLKDRDRKVRRRAARSLEESAYCCLLRSSADFLPMLRSKDMMLRKIGLRAIYRMGPEASSASPHIVRLLGDPVRSIRLDAAFALLEVSPFDTSEYIEPVLEEAREFGEDKDRKRAMRIARVLRSLDP
jgi:HEAT repeat protein